MYFSKVNNNSDLSTEYNNFTSSSISLCFFHYYCRPIIHNADFQSNILVDDRICAFNS